jgi:hypothetical protein
MSDCLGELPVSTKVDREMQEFLTEEAERLGINRSELMRRLFTAYRDSRREETDCPHCGETIKMDLRE